MNGKKLLGYNYYPNLDKISIAAFNTDISKVTKRQVLSYISRIYDPLGLCLPVHVKSKYLMRDIWSSGCDWDSQIPSDLEETWNSLKRDLDRVTEPKFDRCCYTGEVTLVFFCDSSKKGYGFCCYTLSESQGNYCSNLIFSKAKVAPSKSKSLPTLELMSVFLALKCVKSIVESLDVKVKGIYMATDAQIVLSWILNKKVKTKNIYAKNRVNDICNFLKSIQNEYELDVKFRYISTELNPSDLITRGISFKQFTENIEFWTHGPSFLTQGVEGWPVKPLNCVSHENQLLTNLNIINSDKLSCEQLLGVDKFSSSRELFNVTAKVISATHKMRKSNVDEVQCLKESKLYWVKLDQKIYFPTELNYLNKITDAPIPNLVKNLNLFLDEYGVIRCKGRLGNCKFLTFEVKNPILLPKNSKLSQLLVNNFLEECKHLGTASTLAKLRNSGFWLPQGRSVIKKVLQNCITCKKINAHVFHYPKPNNYNVDRTNFVKPFFHTGIDFTGNFQVKLGDKLCKMYIIVYTCLNTRAIYLDLLPSMCCKHFLLSFVRFVNTYTVPRCIFQFNSIQVY